MTAILFLCAAKPAPAVAEGLTVSIVPQQSATRLAKVWTPLLKEVSAQSGELLTFVTAKDIPTFEACLAKGAYDIAYMNPYHYSVFHNAPGYRAFAKQKDKQLRGLIVVRQDADIGALKDLRGETIAFPSPAAFGASIIPRAEMKSQGINFTPKYVKSHDSVYRAVSAGLLPAGGGVVRTFNTVPKDVRDTLKIIYRTSGYTPHAFAAHPDVAADKLARIADSLTGLADSRPELLADLGMSGIVSAVDADWDDVRALGLERNHTEIVEDGDVICHSG
ncbi:MAG: PhnD/SsuA/transferrin family substrate-binding protein [Pseudomonadota bacterium]